MIAPPQDEDENLHCIFSSSSGTKCGLCVYCCCIATTNREADSQSVELQHGKDDIQDKLPALFEGAETVFQQEMLFYSEELFGTSNNYMHM